MVTASVLFSQDSAVVREEDNALYLAGCCIQGYFLIIVLRDLLISITQFVKKERDALIKVFLIHYAAACVDLCLLGLLFIWALTVVSWLPSANGNDYSDDGLSFLRITNLNVHFAFFYIVAHSCVMPMCAFCLLRSASLTRRLQLVQNWHDDAVEEYGPDGESIPSAMRMVQAERAVELLKPCTWAELKASGRLG